MPANVSVQDALFFKSLVPSVSTSNITCGYYISVETSRIKPIFLKFHLKPQVFNI